MSNLFRKQVSPQVPQNGADARMLLELAERAVSLVEQLCFVRWDGRIYDNIKECIADLDEAARARGDTRVRIKINDIKSLVSGFGTGLENKDSSNFSALTESLQQLRALAGELTGIDNNGLATRSSSELMQDGQRVIAFLGEERVLDEHVHWLERAGFEVIHIRLPEDLPDLFARHEPVALVVDLASYEDETGALDFIEPLMKNAACVARLVFLSRRADQEIRLRAIQAGGDTFLTKPINPTLLLQHLELATLARSHDYTVMLVGDSNSLTSRVAPALENAGMTIRCLNNASQALLSVINFSPDLLIVEQSLSDCSGVDLGRVIHQLADYEDLPVIYTGTSREQANDYRPDYPSEWVSPEFLSEEAFILLIDRLVCTSRLRMERLRQLQTIDPVTGLLNRQGFLQLIERGLSIDDYTAIILVEFDNLQQRYPQLPPQQLNRFIAMISRRLERLVLPSGQTAHIGDYAFACIISGKSPDEVRKLGQLMSHSLSSHIFDIEQHSLMVACSIGIAITNGTLADVMSLFTLAVHACDEARLAGNNRVSVRSMVMGAVTRPVETEKAMLELVQDAISDDSFRLVFQPIASLRGSAVEKYEVLLRLDSGKHGPVSPGLFIPVAEENGLMGSIDRWVLVHAIQIFQKHGYHSHFFVKVSSATLRDPGFIQFLEDCLARYGAIGERLVFEISATSISEGVRHVAEFTQRVGMLGCGVLIEHGDVRQDIAPVLENIKASYVKLNADALKSIADDPQRQIHLKTLIDHAEQRAVMTIAGFVEDADYLQLLWQSGVHYIQGNFLQEPSQLLDFEFGVEGTVQENFPA